jgi:hypothetical protein
MTNDNRMGLTNLENNIILVNKFDHKSKHEPHTQKNKNGLQHMISII